MPGFYERYHEMQEGGPYDTEDTSNKIFKCTDCGAETFARDGWDGEPEPGHCHAHCKSRATDWKPGRVSSLYKHNIDGVRMNTIAPVDTGKDEDPKVVAIRNYKENLATVFPNAPGAGI